MDLESGNSGDMFTVARLALASQRAMDNDESRRRTGKLPETSTVRCAEALGWITIEGARMLNMEDRIGSLRPGKQADLVVLSADDLNMWPVHDPVVSVVTQASVANVDSVMIAGRRQKRAGKLAYPLLEEKKIALRESGQRIIAGTGLSTSTSI